MERPVPVQIPPPLGQLAEREERHDSLVTETLAVWQPLTRDPLTRSDARRIASDIGDFLAVLADWDRIQRENTVGGGTPAGVGGVGTASAPPAEGTAGAGPCRQGPSRRPQTKNGSKP